MLLGRYCAFSDLGLAMKWNTRTMMKRNWRIQYETSNSCSEHLLHGCYYERQMATWNEVLKQARRWMFDCANRNGLLLDCHPLDRTAIGLEDQACPLYDPALLQLANIDCFDCCCSSDHYHDHSCSPKMAMENDEGCFFFYLERACLHGQLSLPFDVLDLGPLFVAALPWWVDRNDRNDPFALLAASEMHIVVETEGDCYWFLIVVMSRLVI
mmetsp:Transcript_22474/g.48712  ORF Transcript_22474/g.48712 Transcript_22474/m.48712 type:complete len:212 (-) Transcript_22474:314-949(-)